ncbi:glutamate 5-kinase [Ferroacidibacillus organovorans]|uniref:Glutamate 5-kinase n=1 Tax=Ferroacidibacillus organovorans TaxID=1765683 RepID=A0A1V4EUS1_9BACL|nr:glutamate 5-kinase [Ferroacidibacillus organovorans]OPG16514.1 glutamate 5-kinase [Ferroacidibacillus organovorans]
MRWKRIVVKVGTSSLTDVQGILSHEKLQHVVDSLMKFKRETNARIVLVSSGAVGAGLGILGWSRATMTMPEKQAAAAVGQGKLLSLYQTEFDRYDQNIAQILLTRSDLDDRRRYLHVRNTFETLLSHHVIPIVNENDSVSIDEIRLGDNDSLAAHVSLLTEADAMILLTDRDGLYTSDPRKDPHAKRIPLVHRIDEDILMRAGQAGSVSGTGGMKTKLTAAQIVTSAGIEAVIASIQHANHLLELLTNDHFGTRFSSHSPGLGAKRAWLRHSSRSMGRVDVDSGARDALVNKKASLLMPGILHVEGDFETGSVIDVSFKGERIGRGRTNYASRDITLLLDRKSAAQVEVIHRNHLVLFSDERSDSSV